MKKWTLLAGFLGIATAAFAQSWHVSQRPNLWEIFYRFPNGSMSQYAALHTNDSYFRMIYGSESGWGTSVILMPSFWSGGALYQGTAVQGSYQTQGPDLVLQLTGSRQGLTTQVSVRLFPPGSSELQARVQAFTSGQVTLDTNRPNEAFKPVMLSSMRISNSLWDTRQAYVDCNAYNLPLSGWMIQPAVSGRLFGLIGGTSDWKPNAPTIEVELDQPLTITGWVTSSQDPNDDNVGFWAASQQVMPAWAYTLRATPQRPGYTLSGQLVLGDYAINPAGTPVQVQVRLSSNQDLIRSETVMLDSQGRYELRHLPPGVYDISFKASHWLSRTLRNYTMPANCAFHFTLNLINGDANGDNQVNDEDLLRILFDFGSLQTGDLNGDGICNDLDLLIVLFNFGRTGS